MDVSRLEGTWRNMAWFARMDHQSQEMLCAATVALGWGLNAFYLPQLSYSYLTTYTSKPVLLLYSSLCTAKVQISKF